MRWCWEEFRQLSSRVTEMWKSGRERLDASHDELRDSAGRVSNNQTFNLWNTEEQASMKFCVLRPKRSNKYFLFPLSDFPFISLSYLPHQSQTTCTYPSTTSPKVLNNNNSRAESYNGITTVRPHRSRYAHHPQRDC